MNKKGFSPILIIVLIAVLGIGGYFVYTNYLNNPDFNPLHQTVRPSPILVDETANWKTYTNTKYKFSLKYPTDWRYVEVPTPTYQTQNDEIWFLPQSSPLPPPQTGAMSPVVLQLTISDPSINPQFVENYKSEPYTKGRLQGDRITGTSKADFSINNIVINTGTFYIAALTNDQVKYGNYLDQILSTFKFTQ